MTEKSEDGLHFTPRGAGIFVGALVVAIVLGLASLAGLYRVDDTDRYKGTEAALDNAGVDARLTAVEELLERHEARPWHGDVGVELREQRTRIEALERAAQYPDDL